CTCKPDCRPYCNTSATMCSRPARMSVLARRELRETRIGPETAPPPGDITTAGEGVGGVGGNVALEQGAGAIAVSQDRAGERVDRQDLLPGIHVAIRAGTLQHVARAVGQPGARQCRAHDGFGPMVLERLLGRRRER